MKKVLLFIEFVLVAITGMSQANVVSGAISVQGIARDINSNAVPNTSLTITAELYYLQNSNTVTIESKTGAVQTDAFGIFAYVMEISPSSFIKISNTEAFIKISSQSVTFANEKLRMVPYAIHAQNGVPTGTIMAYAGDPSSVPSGWLLCDGRSIPNDIFHASLRSLLGANGVVATNVPDLRGMFLRGAGTNSDSIYRNNIGPGVRAVQRESIIAHNHPQLGQFTTSTAGQHNHGHHWYTGGPQGGDRGFPTGLWIVGPSSGKYEAGSSVLDPAGNHSHSVTLSGNTGVNGSASETRPLNFGVHYIIKI
jgi:hypothetical protein